MATIKSYTDIEQSRKLIKILPLESADMAYIASATDDDGETLYTAEYKSEIIIHEADDYINCWSLAALISVLPTIDDEFEPQLHRSLDKYRCTYEGEEDSSGLWRVANNPIDACVEMIIKLHELKIL